MAMSRHSGDRDFMRSAAEHTRADLHHQSAFNTPNGSPSSNHSSLFETWVSRPAAIEQPEQYMIFKRMTPENAYQKLKSAPNFSDGRFLLRESSIEGMITITFNRADYKFVTDPKTGEQVAVNHLRLQLQSSGLWQKVGANNTEEHKERFENQTAIKIKANISDNTSAMSSLTFLLGEEGFDLHKMIYANHTEVAEAYRSYGVRR